MSDMAEGMAAMKTKYDDDHDFEYQTLPSVIEGVEKNLEVLSEQLNMLENKISPIFRREPEKSEGAQIAVADMRAADSEIAEQLRDVDHRIRRLITRVSTMTAKVQL